MYILLYSCIHHLYRNIRSLIDIPQDEINTIIKLNNNGVLLMIKIHSNLHTYITRHMDMKRFILYFWIEKDITMNIYIVIYIYIYIYI